MTQHHVDQQACVGRERNGIVEMLWEDLMWKRMAV